MKGIIDRFEGNIAVVEIDGITQDFPKSIFPNHAQVGDIVRIADNVVTVLPGETEKRRKEIEELMDEVWDDD